MPHVPNICRMVLLLLSYVSTPSYSPAEGLLAAKAKSTWSWVQKLLVSPGGHCFPCGPWGPAGPEPESWSNLTRPEGVRTRVFPARMLPIIYCTGDYSLTSTAPMRRLTRPSYTCTTKTL